VEDWVLPLLTGLTLDLFGLDIEIEVLKPHHLLLGLILGVGVLLDHLVVDLVRWLI
jgi:hypothetical protein